MGRVSNVKCDISSDMTYTIYGYHREQLYMAAPITHISGFLLYLENLQSNFLSQPFYFRYLSMKIA